MAPPDDAINMLVREFATALRRAREEETERMRNTLYSLELLRDGMADLSCARMLPQPRRSH
jgi:hypothetical protein